MYAVGSEIGSGEARDIRLVDKAQSGALISAIEELLGAEPASTKHRVDGATIPLSSTLDSGPATAGATPSSRRTDIECVLELSFERQFRSVSHLSPSHNPSTNPRIIEVWPSYNSDPVLAASRKKRKLAFSTGMKQAVTRTRENLADRIEEVVSFGKEIDRNTLDDLEATLISANMSSTTTQEILGKLRRQADRKQIKNVEELKRLLKEEILYRLSAPNTRCPESRWHSRGDSGCRSERDGRKLRAIGKIYHISFTRKNALLCAADTFVQPRLNNSKSGRTGHRSDQDEKPERWFRRSLFDTLQAIRTENELCGRRYSRPSSYQNKPDVRSSKRVARRSASFPGHHTKRCL